MIYAKNLNTNTKTGGGGTLVWDGRSWNNAPSTPTIERAKTTTPSPSSSQSSGGSSSRSSSSGSSSQPTAKNLNTDTSTGGGGNLVWDGTRWNDATASAPAKPANMTAQPTIQRTTSRASGTGAPSNPTPLPLAARAPSASYGLTGATQPTITRGIGTPRYSLSVSGGGGITDQDRKKALEDELAALWGYMEKYKGTMAYDGYARRAAEIEAEQKAASEPAGATIQRTPTPGAFGSGVTSAGRPASYNTAPGQQMQTPAKVGERRPNPYGGEDVVWSGTSWDSATEWAAKQAKAAQPPMPTIERPRPAAAPPPTTSDYVPPTTSRFESTPGFDQPQYAEAYNQAHVNDIKKQYQRNLAALQENFAARGLGNSQAAQQAYIQSEMDMRGQLGEIGADSKLKSIEMGRTDAIQRAGQIDNYGLARGGFGISYAADNRAAKQQDTMLPLDAQIKVLEAAGINLRNAGIQLANDGSVIQNDHNRAIVDFYKQTRNIDMTRMQQGVDAGALDLQKSANELEILRGTTPDRIAQIKAAATSAQLANERTRFDIDYATSVADTTRRTAEAQLREIEQRVAAAAQKQDWAMVDELGKIAGRVAKAGGFKVAGGFLAAAMLTNPVTAAAAPWVAGAGAAADIALGG